MRFVNQALLALIRATIACALASCGVASVDAQDDLVLVGEVVRVVDGDTADVLLESGEIRVRFHGIDAPERNQPYGDDAESLLRGLIDGREVELQVVEQDRYDRLVARVYVGGVDANAEMLKRGAAYAERRYLRQVEDGESYCHMEHEARTAKLGLWRLPASDRIAPWEWREGEASRADYTDYTDETAEGCIDAIGESRAAARRSGRAAPTAADGTPTFACGEARVCREMASCAEATFHLKQCGLSSLDRDRDGVPCEDICR